jgi:putative transposase
MPRVEYSTEPYENKRCELFHQATRKQERQMRRFTSQGQAQGFLSRIFDKLTMSERMQSP